MKAVAYIRVSSKAQTLDLQRHAIRQAAKVRGDQVGTWYEEKLSAKTLARPELVRLRADARAGRVARLYVYRLDRLARSGIRDTFEVVEELRGHGVDLVALEDGFSLTGPAAEVVLAVMAWAAKMERIAINERIAAARVRLEAEGRHWGRPTRVTPDELEQMRKLQARGLSLREIAQHVSIPRPTVARALSRKVPPLPAASKARPAARRRVQPPGGRK